MGRSHGRGEGPRSSGADPWHGDPTDAVPRIPSPGAMSSLLLHHLSPANGPSPGSIRPAPRAGLELSAAAPLPRGSILPALKAARHSTAWHGTERHGMAWRGPASAGPWAAPAAAPLAHLERLQPHEARLALLVLKDEEGPPILIKRQSPHGRHGCAACSDRRCPPATPGSRRARRARPRACAAATPAPYFAGGTFVAPPAEPSGSRPAPGAGGEGGRMY